MIIKVKVFRESNCKCLDFYPKAGSWLSSKCFLVKCRVAMAQGKQGIWLLTFPDRENTGNLVNLIFYTGKIVATQGKF